MPGISIHVVDVALGKPAAGMFVEVHALDGDNRSVVGTGVVGENGAFEHPMNAGEGVAAGSHEVLLRLPVTMCCSARANTHNGMALLCRA